MNEETAGTGSTGASITTGQLTEFTELIAKNGPDPVLLGAILICVMLMLGLMVYLIRRSSEQQDQTLKHFQSQATVQQDQALVISHQQRQEFRTELNLQREAHMAELGKQTSAFERSLDKIVESSKEGMSAIGSKLGVIENRLERVEGFMTGGVTQISPVQEKAKAARKNKAPKEKV